jgi:hypothetical protein
VISIHNLAPSPAGRLTSIAFCMQILAFLLNAVSQNDTSTNRLMPFSTWIPL